MADDCPDSIILNINANVPVNDCGVRTSGGLCARPLFADDDKSHARLIARVVTVTCSLRAAHCACAPSPGNLLLAPPVVVFDFLMHDLKQ